MGKLLKRVILDEEKVIGNLQDQFRKPTLRAQRLIGISPAIATGNIALAYHRGLAVGREETIKEIVRLLKKQFPQASEFIKNHYNKHL